MKTVDREPRRSPAGLALVGEGTCRMAALLPLPGLLREIGRDPDRLIGEAGVDIALFADPENTIPFVAMGRLLAHCAAATQCPHLGLALGRRSGLETLGLIGQLAAAAPDLGSALRAIILYSHLHDRGAVPLLWEQADQARLGYVIHWPDVPGTHPIYDGALAITFNVLTTLGGPDWTATEVALHPAPNRDLAPYRAFFRCPLRIGARHAAVSFPATYLTRPLAGADPAAYVRILREIEAMEALRGIGFRKRVERVLRRLLIADDPLGGTSLEQMAALFSLHPRTLNRRLQAEGTSFRALLDETRYRIARQLLRDTLLGVEDLAVAIGYADATAFSRAFRRWSGTAPSRWRATQPRG
ncbi:MAG: AraC family transcriptional regulator [Chromatiaceae bacterium]|nr:AraC family transcriptional regulator [Chromatiaceae bacterium]